MGFSFGQQEQQSQSQQSSSSNSSSKSSSTSTDWTPEAFKNLQGPLADQLKAMFQGPMTPGGGGFGGGGASGEWGQYGSQNFAAGETANEATIRNQFLMPDLQGPRQSLLNDTMQGKYTDPNTNPFLNDYIRAAQRTNLEGLTETLERTLPGRFTQAGQMIQPGGSSAFDRAAAIATRGVAQANADIATKIGFQAYDAERGRQNEAIGASQQETQTTIANLTAQGLPRIIEQHGIDEGLKMFQVQMAGILEALKNAASITQPTLGHKAESSSKSSSESSGTSSGSGSGWNAGVQLSPTPPGV